MEAQPTDSQVPGSAVNDYMTRVGNPDLKTIEEGFALVLDGLGIDWQAEPHFRDTPKRAAKAWYNELCVGLTGGPPKMTTFPAGGQEMVLLQDIPVKSMCAHHLLPFVGTAAVAYVPGKEKLIVGISKLSRIVNFFARRPQVQEDLTTQIADFIATRIVGLEESDGKAPIGGVGVMIRANHMCMALRGVGHEGNLVTSAVRGVFMTKPEAREEFLKLADKQ